MMTTKKVVIVLFVSVNAAIMFIDGFPDKSALGRTFLQKVAPYQGLVMLYQPWSMFAPNPLDTNAFIEADLEFTDGSVDQWQMPRPLNLTGIRKFLISDRYRIFGQESLLPNQNEQVWFDVSKYVTRITMEKEKNTRQRTLRRIVFKRLHSQIKPLAAETFIPHGQLSKSHNIDYVFYYTPVFKEERHEAKNNH